MFWILVSCIFILLIALNKLDLSILRWRCPYGRFRQGPGMSIVGGIVMSFLDVSVFIDIMLSVMNYLVSPLKLWIGDTVIIIHDPKQIKEVVHNPNTISKGIVQKVGKEWLGNGLFMCDTSRWKVQRKIMHAIFATRDVQIFSDIVNKHTVQLLKKLSDYLDGQEFDVMEQTSPFAFGIICEDVLGVEVSDDQKIFYYHEIKSAMDSAGVRVYRLWYYFDIFLRFSTLRKKEMRSVKHINEFITGAIADRTNLLKQRRKEGDRVGDQKPVLDIVLEDHSAYTDEELRDEMNSMLLAGFETTGASLGYILFLLANHRNVQEKVYQELYEIYGLRDPEEAPTTVSDIPKLEYLNRVIKESLRIIPVVGFLVREIPPGTTIGDETFWKRYTAFLFILYMHRCAEYWPNPCDYEPDRFLPDHPLACRNPEAYMPFGAGPRNCIGKKIAMLTLTIVLATILRKYNIKTNRPQRPTNLKLKIFAATIPAESIMLTVERRVAHK